MMLLAYGCTSRCHIGKNGSEGLTVKVASYGNKSIAFGVIANGSGDRKIADVACASSIKIYSDWFFEQLKEDTIRFAESNIDRTDTMVRKKVTSEIVASTVIDPRLSTLRT
jgi:hypothetical protein